MMRTDDNRPYENLVDQLLDELPPQDLAPAAAMRIEVACLARLRRRRIAFHLPESLPGVIEALIACLLGGSYLLATLGRALVLYGVYFR